jgi:uncharacterized protein YfaQ (DUF2300 family)
MVTVVNEATLDIQQHPNGGAVTYRATTLTLPESMLVAVKTIAYRRHTTMAAVVQAAVAAWLDSQPQNDANVGGTPR